MASENHERRIYGPPGTGKTTELARLVRECARVVDPSSIMIASFTKAAAAEIAGRDLPLLPHQIGTLHAHCFRALRHPVIAESRIDEFNAENEGFALSGGKSGSLDEPTVEYGEAPGDPLFMEYQRLRARMVPREKWDFEVAAFGATWDAWKDENYLLDFTDLIERCFQDVDQAPESPQIIFFDEAQDSSNLEMALLRKWANKAEVLYSAGDDDQSLYSFKGADGRSFLYPEIPDEHQKVLDYSWRLPRRIQRYATEWIKAVAARKEKIYRPRQEDGRIVEGNLEQSDLAYADGRSVAARAERESKSGKTVMILASCSYMLTDIVAKLREDGIPFHNPYRRRRGDWNPLGGSRGVTAAQRLLMFLQPQKHIYLDQARMWTAGEVEKWTSVLESKGTLKRGAKAWLAEQMKVNTEWRVEELGRIFEPGALRMALDGDVDWYADHLLDSKQASFKFPLTVIERSGINGLRNKPRIIVGTIHSTKGGEADTVLLFPDLSRAAWKEREKGREGEDAITRMMYVGMTRAKEKLVLCRESGQDYVDWPREETR